MPIDVRMALDQGTVLFDGPMGSMLLDRGLELGGFAESWLLERPDEIRNIHRAYADAGAEVITTCTFGATRANLERCGLGAQTTEINRTAAALAREAAGSSRWVAGNIGPLRRHHDAAASAATQLSAFTEQAQLLADAGADCILIETMADLGEALSALAAGLSTDLPVLCCMTFGVEPRGPVSYCGFSPTECARALSEAGADAIGTNCMVCAQPMAALTRAIAAGTDRPLLALPNAGQPEARAGGGFDYAEDPSGFARDAMLLLDAGARGVGGCCGTTPAHIAALRRLLDARAA